MPKYFLSLALLICGQVLADPPVVLVFGDSLSSGHGLATPSTWVSLLQSRLRQHGYPHQVVNASISGDTTANGVTRIRSTLTRHRPEVVILELGGNDGLRGLTLDSVRNNLVQLIEAAYTFQAKVVLAGMRLPPNYGSEYVIRFEKMFSELAQTYDTGLIPFFLEGVASIPGMMQEDGIHPAQSAQPLILNNVWQHLEPFLESSRGSGVY